MSDSLVIIEAPKKAAKIGKCLGPGYSVFATVGHIADLPAKGLSVDIKKDFEPTYAVYDDKKDIVKDLLKRAKKADKIFLMTDADREGEAIGWHVSRLLPESDKAKIQRVSTTAITKESIQKALKNTRGIDLNMVEAYEARRILDRLAGYKTSFIVKRATGGPSAGRVQSSALAILSEREKEIQSFIPIVYWPVTAELLTKKDDKIIADVRKPKALDISTKEQADKICDTIKKGPVVVSKFDKKEVKNQPPKPFTSNEIYRAASSVFGWKTKKTASVAQSLYSIGVITYHRTDSTSIDPDAVGGIRNVVASMGNDYLPSKSPTYAASKNAQEAHEACRVVDVNVKEYNSGGRDEHLLYEMIWKRTVASQMTPTRKLAISAEFTAGNVKLGASGSKLLFDGWRKVWNYGKITDTELPEMEVGDVVRCIGVVTERKETQPPPRYSEASFLKKLEEAGIGRPSTYPSIPATLEARGYMESTKSLMVTPLGLKVNDFLAEVGFCFAEVVFTADMEEKLDKIARGEATKIDVLNEFWNRLKSDIDKSKDFKKELVIADFPCPTCGAEVAIRESKYGKFFSCTLYKDKENKCDWKANVGEDGKPEVKAPPEESEHKCPNCDIPFVIRTSKKTGKQFLGCSNWKSGCDAGLHDLDGNKIEFKKKPYKKKPYKKKSKKKTKKKTTKKSKSRKKS